VILQTYFKPTFNQTLNLIQKINKILTHIVNPSIISTGIQDNNETIMQFFFHSAYIIISVFINNINVIE